MAKTNVKVKAEPVFTHGGGLASLHVTKEQELRRSVLSNLLYEGEFYEDGVSITKRIEELIPQVEPEKVAKIVSDARNKMHLRHVPLFITRIMAKLPTHKGMVAELLEDIVQRADELAEFLAMYLKDGKQPISAQVKKGLARAFNKFNAFQIAKYNRDNTVKLKDVMFLTHPKPFATAIENDQIKTIPAINKPKYKRGEVTRHLTGKGKVFKDLVEDTLAIPETWEVGISASKDNSDKKAVFEKLMNEKKLGGMALLRNLRKMEEVGVDTKLIKHALVNTPMDKVLPFRFIAAAKHAPKYESEIEQAMLTRLAQSNKLSGKTVVIIDVSGSMYNTKISAKSEMDRANAACAMAMLCREVCEDVAIYATAGNDRTKIHQTEFVPSRRGFSLSDAIYKMCKPLGGGGIFLKQVMDYVFKKEGYVDRVIVITDEQDCSRGGVDAPSNANIIGKNNYMINVASYKNGIGYGKWTKLNGFSEAILDYIYEFENIQQ